jgi:chromosome segregation ATPase
MPAFTIKITTPAELSGAKAALELLEKQIGAAKVLGKSLQEIEALEAKAANARRVVSEAEKDVVPALKDSAEATSKNVVKTEEWRAAVAALGTEIPNLGVASAALVSGWAAGVAVLALGFNELTRELREQKKELKEFNDLLPAYAKHADATRNSLEELRKMRVETAGVADDIRRLGAEELKLAGVRTRASAALREQGAAAETARSSLQSLLDVTVKLAEQNGKLPPGKGDAIKAVQELRSVEQKAASERLAELQVIDDKQKQLIAARGTLAQSQAELPNFEGDLAAKKAEQTRLTENLDLARKVANPAGEVRKAFDTTEQAYQKAAAANPELAGLNGDQRAARVEDLKRQLATISAAPSDGSSGAALAKGGDIARLSKQIKDIEAFGALATHRDTLLKSFDDAQRAVAELPDRLAELDIAIASRIKDITERRTAATTAKTAVEALPGEIGALNGTLQTNQTTRDQQVQAARIKYELQQPPPAAQTPHTSQEFYQQTLRRAAQIQGRGADSPQAQRDQQILNVLDSVIAAQTRDWHQTQTRIRFLEKQIRDDKNR